MRILSPSQMKAWDAYTIQHQPIAAIDLMERACEAFTNWFVQRFSSSEKILIVCGTGNNGGDGLGIARLLYKNRYLVSVWIVNGAAQTAAFKLNYDRLPKDIERLSIHEASGGLRRPARHGATLKTGARTLIRSVSFLRNLSIAKLRFQRRGTMRFATILHALDGWFSESLEK